MKSPEKTLRAVATMKPVTMAIVRKDGAVDTVWSSQMAVIAPSFDGIDRRRPNLNKRLAVSRSRAGGGIMMMMWLLNFQENSADMVWWLSSLLSHALPDKNSSLDDSEKKCARPRGTYVDDMEEKFKWFPMSIEGSIDASYFNRSWFQYAMLNAFNTPGTFARSNSARARIRK